MFVYKHTETTEYIKKLPTFEKNETLSALNLRILSG